MKPPPFKSRFLKGAVAILVRYRPHLEVLLIRRSEHLKAYPGYWAFPGGRSDDDDAHEAETALRELFEETGLYLTSGKKPLPNSERQRLQNALNAQRTTWETVASQLGYTTPWEQMPLQFLGWRVAPPIHPVRFEAAYYLIEEDTAMPPFCSGEISEARWWQPAALIASWEQHQALIPPPVMGVLRILAAVKTRITPQHMAQLQAIENHRDRLYEDMEIHPALEMLPLQTPTLAPATHTNTYLVGREQFVIIDPATPYPSEQAVLLSRIEARLKKGHLPQAVLLTHHHGDHVGAASEVQRRFQLPLMAHQKTKERLRHSHPDLVIDQILEDGHTWALGTDAKPFKLEAIHTPGHAPGHLCFVVTDQSYRWGVVGDMVAGIGSIVIQHPAGSDDPDGDMQAYIASLKQLQALQLRRAFPAHGPMITKPHTYFQQYIDHRLEREAQILEALEQNAAGLSLKHLRESVYPNLDILLYTFAEDSLRAHLVKLRKENRITLSDQQNTAIFSLKN